MQSLVERFESEDWPTGLRTLPAGISVEQAARTCLEFASFRPDQVSVLLEAQPAVAHAAWALLENHPHAEPLALALMHAGYDLSREENLPATIQRLIDKRQQESKWSLHSKQQKYLHQIKLDLEQHKFDGKRVGIPYERDAGSPYLSLSPAYSQKNFNAGVLRHKHQPKDYHGSLMHDDGRVRCRHLAEALADPATAKENLKRLSKGDVTWITEDQVRIANWRQFRPGLSTVHFSWARFGKVLNTLAQRLKAGEERSFSMSFAVTNAITADSGHAMRVYIKKFPQSELLKVWLYEPNRTCDRMHMTGLPEQLRVLNFGLFDANNTCKDAAVLSIDVEDQVLAEQLADTCVEDKDRHLAYAEALAHGNVEGMKALGTGGPPSSDAKAPMPMLLSKGLHFALHNGHGEAIELLGEHFSPAALGEILREKHGFPVPSQHIAMFLGHLHALKAWGTLLKKCALEPEALLEILLAKDANGNTALGMALENDLQYSIWAFGEMLKACKPGANVLKEILLATNAQGVPGIWGALTKQRIGAIRAYAIMVITLQQDPATQLRGEDAQVLGKLMRISQDPRFSNPAEIIDLLKHAEALLANPSAP